MSPSTASVGIAVDGRHRRTHLRAEPLRAVAHSSSRSSLRAIVSPSSRSTTMPAAPRTEPSSAATTSATGTPAPAAARSSAASVPDPDARARSCALARTRCRISGRRAAPVDQIERPRLARGAPAQPREPLDRGARRVEQREQRLRRDPHRARGRNLARWPAGA